MKPLYIDKSARKYQSFPVHQHKVWEITVNLTGSGIATVVGQEYPFREGTIFCVAPGIPHGKVSPDGFIDGSLMLLDFTPPGDASMYQFEDDFNGTFRYLFDLMFDILMKDDHNAQAIINSLAEAMYQIMVSWSAAGHRNTTVERFQKTLLDNLSNCDFDLSAAAKELGYSPSYFRKLFKSFTGHSPVNYFNRLRIEYAKRQIQQYFGFRSMQEIARSSGFDDPYYFSRVFRQFTGMNPLKYGKETSILKAKKINGEHLVR